MTAAAVAAAVLAGLATGMLLGLTGAGGSVLTLPALVAIVGLRPNEAVAASLLSVGLTAGVGLVGHARRGDVIWRAAAGFAAAGALAALIGGHLGRRIPDDWLMAAFGLLMLVVAALMARSGGRSAPPLSVGAMRADGTRRPRLGTVLGGGAGVGLLSGTLGIGGGFLVVPALSGPLGLPMRAAVGTSLLVVAINAGSGLAGALTGLSGAPLVRALPFILASLVGGRLGAALAGRLSARRMAMAFCLLVLGVGVAVLFVYVPRLT
jgi:hypothetical protein